MLQRYCAKVLCGAYMCAATGSRQTLLLMVRSWLAVPWIGVAVSGCSRYVYQVPSSRQHAIFTHAV
jgi:hypothetical protein